MKAKNLITAVVLTVTGLVLAACGSSADGTIGSGGLSDTEVEAAVRAACAGEYATTAECEECVANTLNGMGGFVDLDGQQIDRHSTLFHGECSHGGISGSIEICHVPPGNPANAHTITVSPNARRAHLAHGDTEGPCGGTELDCDAAIADVANVFNCSQVAPDGGCAFDVSGSFLPFDDPNFNCDTVCAKFGLSCLATFDSDFTMCLAPNTPLDCATLLPDVGVQPDMLCHCGP